PFCVPDALPRSPRAPWPSDREPLPPAVVVRSELAALEVDSVVAREGSVGDALERSADVPRLLSDPLLPAAFCSSALREGSTRGCEAPGIARADGLAAADASCELAARCCC